MTTQLSRAAASLADLANALESGDQPEVRIGHAVEQIRRLTSSDACVFASTASPLAPSLVVTPTLPPSEEVRLGRDAVALLQIVVDRGDRGPRGASVREGGGRPHLAVPLIALGEVVGMLVVEREGEPYVDTDLQLLAIAASQLGAYLAIVKARDAQWRSEIALGEALAQTRAADERKAQFLRVLSHELRNPLAPLRNAVYVLERADPAAASAQRARGIIGRQVEQLARLVDDLLDSTRISSGKVHLRRARIDLAEVVGRTVDDHRSGFLREGVELRSSVPGTPLWVDADETRIVQVVGNLLGNALKFTSRGGHVEVSLERAAPDTALLRVRDDGVGMMPETLSHVFDQFAQGTDTLARSQAGLGLGLALAKGLVEIHGGTIEAHSAGAGRGSEFVIRLPALAAADVEPSPQAAARPSGGQRRRILVIDDNRDAAESLRDLLQVGGHTVEVALDGPAGIALARSTPFDVVLCDIGMPGMDGYEVARALREVPAAGRAVLVALTGFGSSDDRARALGAGFDRHLVKPVALSALEEILESPSTAPGDTGARQSE